MVATNGQVSMTILKARFGSDVRKTPIHHAHDLTLNDLTLMLQRIFKISSAEAIVLKYKDSDGDLVSLADDSDLLLALQSEKNLSIEVSLDNNAAAELNGVQQQISQLQADVQRLYKSLASIQTSNNHTATQPNESHHFEPVGATLSHGDHIPTVPINGFDATPLSPPSPVPSEKPEMPATIQPSLQEQVLPDGLSRHEISPPCVDEIPLEAGAPPASAPPNNNFATPPLTTSAIQDPHAPQQQGFTPQPPHLPSIPSFPHANVPPANFSPTHQQHDQMPPQPPHQFVPPHQHSVPPQMPPSNFAPAPQQNFGTPLQQFAPPPQAPQQPQPPTPQSSVSSTPIPQPSQQFGGASHGGLPQQFVPPQQAPSTQFAPPPTQGFGALPMQHQQQQQQFVPPSSTFGHQPQFGQATLPSEPAPPAGGMHPPFAPPPTTGFAPPPIGAPPGVPGGNPFARVPGPGGYRNSPYH
ncbi:hypothetical protein KIN20_013293 [Parelaphostrongylus tenuis]|uniref:PB1 domain-containing protein n=1 Tax=Parelaphostrongylus tenuis TaxID=148309 RepID=A0AAD5MXX0_PARTN|nr:hypothetical protein KIN20_013293 [Parelaphostrongylus tenuis]